MRSLITSTNFEWDYIRPKQLPWSSLDALTVPSRCVASLVISESSQAPSHPPQHLAPCRHCHGSVQRYIQRQYFPDLNQTTTPALDCWEVFGNFYSSQIDCGMTMLPSRCRTSHAGRSRLPPILRQFESSFSSPCWACFLVLPPAASS
jgi:hypothetical protein